MAQIHAIVYAVNNNQFLIQDDIAVHPDQNVEKSATQSDIEYNVFMDEMAKLTWCLHGV